MTSKYFHKKNCLSYFIRLVVFIAVLLVNTNETYSQKIRAYSKLDTSSILIGEQVELFLQFSHPINFKSSWTYISDSISGLEVVSKNKIDTLIENGIITKSQSILLTSFDSGYYAIPPFVFTYTEVDDTAILRSETEALLLEVNTIAIDTTKAIKDIKDLKRIPFGWQDALPYIYGVIALILLAYLVFLYFKKRKKKDPKPVAAPKIPAHITALEELKKLEEAKLWQQGFTKEFHSRLSEIIRTFIGDKWHIPAMELTTYEIMKIQQIKSQSTEINSTLNNVLLLADLVKFAKASPIQHENENSLKVAYAFVNANIPIVNDTVQEREDTK